MTAADPPNAVSRRQVVVVGSGSAALCAAMAAREAGAEVLVLEKADQDLAGGNSRYTAGAMRFAYEGFEDLLPLLSDPDDPRLADAEFGAYPEHRFAADLLSFDDGDPLTREQHALVSESYAAVRWLAERGVGFEPIYSRQSFEKDGRRVFWGGLTLAAVGEGTGLVNAELAALLAMGGHIGYESEVTGLVTEDDSVVGVEIARPGGTELVLADAVVLACGGFEANVEQRVANLGPEWAAAKVRGTPHNTGTGISLARALGAQAYGALGGCHATPMDRNTPDYGNLDTPHSERKNYRKICYFLGLMLNRDGQRFVDEGRDFRNYTYAQFGGEILRQPGGSAWQIFDDKVTDLLYEEYRFRHASFVEADTMEGLLAAMDQIDSTQALATIEAFNHAVHEATPFDPTIKDGKAASGVDPPKSNWAQTIDTPPFRAYPVTGGITFTYGGLRVDDAGAVLRSDGSPIDGLFACGELIGGVFRGGYPGGSGLTSGAVFGRRAGVGAAALTLGSGPVDN